MQDEVTVFQGHMPLGHLESELQSRGVCTKTFVVLRDPVSRLKSHIAYLLSRDALFERAQKLWYVSHPLMSLGDILIDHQYRWLTNFYSGHNDICSIEGQAQKIEVLLSRVFRSPQTVHEFLGSDSSGTLLLPSSIDTIDTLASDILGFFGYSQDEYRRIMRKIREDKQLANQTPMQYKELATAICKTGTDDTLGMQGVENLNFLLGDAGISFSNQAINRLLEIVMEALSTKSFDHTLYAHVTSLSSGSTSKTCILL